MKYDHPVLTKIHEQLLDLLQDGKGNVSVWVPGHVGIRGNTATDAAGKDVLDGDSLDETIPFSELKPRMNKYIMELWQHEWGECPDDKLQQVRPKLTDYFPSCRTKRGGETVLARLHIGHSYLTHTFLLKGVEHPVCIS